MSGAGAAARAAAATAAAAAGRQRHARAAGRGERAAARSHAACSEHPHTRLVAAPRHFVERCQQTRGACCRAERAPLRRAAAAIGARARELQHTRPGAERGAIGRFVWGQQKEKREKDELSAATQRPSWMGRAGIVQQRSQTLCVLALTAPRAGGTEREGLGTPTAKQRFFTTANAARLGAHIASGGPLRLGAAANPVAGHRPRAAGGSAGGDRRV